MEVRVDAEHFGAFTGKRDSGASTVSPAVAYRTSAYDDCNFVLQPIRHVVLVRDRIVLALCEITCSAPLRMGMGSTIGPLWRTNRLVRRS